jgi:hypothetical protein
MDQYALIDHDALVRNLNVVCGKLGEVMDSCGLYCGPPALTRTNVEEDIPFALHKIAVAAGWIDPSVELETEDFDSGRAELLGGVLVDVGYMEWFLGLVSETLNDLAAQAGANTAAQERDYEGMLRAFANGSQAPQRRADADNRKRKAERSKREVPDTYPDGIETPKGILDRRRKRLHLTWPELQQVVEKDFVKRAQKRQQQLALVPPSDLGFSVDLLYAMRRGHTPDLHRLQSVAAALSDAKETIQCEALEWRLEYSIK